MSSSSHRSDLPHLRSRSDPDDSNSPFPHIHSVRSSTTIHFVSLYNTIIPNCVVRLQQRQQFHFSQDFLILLHAIFQINFLYLQHNALSSPTAYFIPSNRCVHNIIRPNPPWPISFSTIKSVLNRLIEDYKTHPSAVYYRISSCQFFWYHFGTLLFDFIQRFQWMGRLLGYTTCPHVSHIVVFVVSSCCRPENP